MITQNLIDLVDLALVDAVLTQKEREVLLNAAAKDGISAEEANIYINSQLDIRLKTRDKAELKACPSCGAQIPLLAHCCPYCHHEYTAHHSRNLDEIESYDANLIRAENRKTAEEQENIGQCPNCGHPYPLISNICPACSHVLHYGESNKSNVERLIGRIYIKINELNLMKDTSLWDIFKYRHPEYCFVALAISIVILRVNPNVAENQPFSFLTLPLDLMGIFFLTAPIIVRILPIVGNEEKAFNYSFLYPLKRGESPMGIRNKAAGKLISEYQSLENQLDTIYGADRECKPLLENIRKQMDDAIAKHRKKCTGIVFKNIILLAIMGLVGFMAISGNHERRDDVVQSIFSRSDTKIMQQSKFIDPTDDKSFDNCTDNVLAQYMLVKAPAHMGITLRPDDKAAYILEGLCVKSSGTPLPKSEDADRFGIALTLLDKNCKQIDPNLYLFCANEAELIDMLKSGKGQVYTTYYSKSFSRSQISEMQELIGKTEYYALIHYTKNEK